MKPFRLLFIPIGCKKSGGNCCDEDCLWTEFAQKIKKSSIKDTSPTEVTISLLARTLQEPLTVIYVYIYTHHVKLHCY